MFGESCLHITDPLKVSGAYHDQEPNIFHIQPQNLRYPHCQEPYCGSLQVPGVIPLKVNFLTVAAHPLRSKLGALLYRRKTQKVLYDFDEFLLSHDTSGRADPDKKALVSYLVGPLQPPPDKRDVSTFSNAGIAQYIPRALNELGYSVDIVNYDNRKFVPSKKYDLFFGHGGINFEQIAKTMGPGCTKIYFSTGIYWKEWNRVEKERLAALGRRKGVVLPADRFIEQDEESANLTADGIICLGNDHARSTYDKFPLVLNVNNAVFSDPSPYPVRNFSERRNNFLFFNGPGNVHKGLDLLLEAFSGLKQHLYVRQAIEPEFFKVYEKELTGRPNIHLLPFLKKPSHEFSSLMGSCAFVISPTCAEGQPGSVIECMAHGLIPVLSREANIDTKEFGITLSENSVEEITSVVRALSDKDDPWFREKSAGVLEEVRQYYTPEHFLSAMKSAIGSGRAEPINSLTDRYPRSSSR